MDYVQKLREMAASAPALGQAAQAHPTVAAGVTLLLLPMAVVVYRLFFHPLARVPGPRLAAITTVWYAYQTRKGRARELTKMLHETYGPVVRVCPNQVWFDTEEAFRQVYRAGSPFGKADWYYSVAHKHGPIRWFPLKREAPDTLDLISETHMPRYRMQRRLIGPAYSAANMLNHEPALDDVLQRFVAKLKEQDGKEIDLSEWMHILAMESITAITFRWSPGMIENGSNYGTLMDGYFKFWRYLTVVGMFPRVILISHYLGLWSRHFLQKLVDFGVEKCPKPPKNIWMGIMGQVFSQSVGSRDLNKEPIGGLTDDLVRLHQEKPEFKQEYLTEMVASTMRAGGDTMTGTLTAILTLGNGDPAIKARLRREADEGLPPVSEKPVVSFREGTGLEYTTATIKESTRHWPVVGLAMYREVPERGLTLSDGSGHEYYIPPGTTVGASPLALQCNKAIFGDDAEEFRPERWLGDEKTRLALEKYSLVFGSQDRSCPGRNISEQVIYKSIPTLMRHFDIEVRMPDKMLTYGTALMTGVKAKFHVRK